MTIEGPHPQSLSHREREGTRESGEGEGLSLGKLYQATRKRFLDAGLETPDLDARILIAHATGLKTDAVILTPEEPVTVDIEPLILRRLAREPVAKIIGRKEFYGLDFIVSKDVLDPRPDTEVLVEHALKLMPPNAHLLDICTGTGCILASLLHTRRDATGTGVDISKAALAIAQHNLDALGVKAELIRSDYLTNVTGQYDIITCNPPYIETATLESLDADVRLYDPHLALDGGDDGLTPYKILFPQIRHILRPGGHALFEFGAGQARDVARLGADAGLEVSAILNDMSGHERVAVLR